MIKRYEHISLCDRNSFGIDVECRELVEFSHIEELRELFSVGSAPERWMVVGGGNNILFTQNFDGTIICSRAEEITIESDDECGVVINIEAGADWDGVVEWSVEQGLWGVENLSKIPGTAGAAPIQNIGAYGVELSDALVSVDYFDPATDSIHRLSREECRLGYRDSIFKRELRGRVVITSIKLRLSRSANPRLDYADLRARVEAGGEVSLRAIREVVCSVRDSKLPDPKVLGNAGSFFKNPIVRREVADKLKQTYPDIPIYHTQEPQLVKLAAGWLIDRGGLKGHREGSVGMHSAQALVMVNYGGATGREVVEFACRVQQKIEAIFGVAIECEVNIV